MRFSVARVLLLFVFLIVAGCGGRKARSAKPPKIGSTETGVASWYGHPYHGRRAANGEVYDMDKLTAAHRTLPFDTWVRVRNLSNERTVDVRIQDRGPFIRGRIIDLSRAAARQIELIGPGTAKVKLTVIAPPPPVAIAAQKELFGVQIGAFRDRARAEAVRADMERAWGAARIVERTAAETVYRVLVGAEEDQAQAAALAERLRAAGMTGFVVRLDNGEPAN